MPGDRSAGCGARMMPIGLKYKHQNLNLYTGRLSGELMIVHKCLNCGAISANRIAGDDSEFAILGLLNASAKNRINGIKLLTEEDYEEVAIALFGYNYKEEIDRRGSFD